MLDELLRDSMSAEPGSGGGMPVEAPGKSTGAAKREVVQWLDSIDEDELPGSGRFISTPETASAALSTLPHETSENPLVVDQYVSSPAMK